MFNINMSRRQCDRIDYTGDVFSVLRKFIVIIAKVRIIKYSWFTVYSYSIGSQFLLLSNEKNLR